MGKLNIFRISIPDKDAQGRQRFFNFECDADSVETLAKRLSDGAIVSGNHLVTRRVMTGDDAGKYEVFDRRPVAIGKTGVSSIEVPWVAFVEYADAAGDA